MSYRNSNCAKKKKKYLSRETLFFAEKCNCILIFLELVYSPKPLFSVQNRKTILTKLKILKLVNSMPMKAYY